MRLQRIFLRLLEAAALTAAVSSQVHAQSGRLSLAERVARLEQQDQSGQSTVELVNRITELRAEVQTLRGLVEQQSYKLQELEKRNRDQYLDLDARIVRLQSAQSGSGEPLLDAEALPPMTTPYHFAPRARCWWKSRNLGYPPTPAP